MCAHRYMSAKNVICLAAGHNLAILSLFRFQCFTSIQRRLCKIKAEYKVETSLSGDQ